MDSSFGQFVRQLLDEERVQGIAIAFGSKDDAARVYGFGVCQRGSAHPVTSSTVFEAASLAKPVFAVFVLRLVASGVIDLDAPLTSYSAERPITGDERLDAVTARLVLSHRTGFPNWFGDQHPEFIAEPGTTFTYSGEAYNWLGRVIEHALGEPLQHVLRREILDPLGMLDTRLTLVDVASEDFAWPHDMAGRPVMRSADANESVSLATMYTSAADYARFVSCLFGRENREREIVPEALRDEMLTQQTVVAPEVYWGLGWGIERYGARAYLHHWGDNPGYKHVTVVQAESGSFIVVLTNGDNGLAVYRPIVRRWLGHDLRFVDWLARPRR